ncbi:hypothetical protein E5288_WYG006960 [Bos mutus]|uniref:Uncharacterized protein n=1 Tax=Bos mutus TaxID=72004 RepID=A0A6B0QS46_9CETA|nr:hypothetical protein [Bos mutus]
MRCRLRLVVAPRSDGPMPDERGECLRAERLGAEPRAVQEGTLPRAGSPDFICQEETEIFWFLDIQSNLPVP